MSDPINNTNCFDEKIENLLKNVAKSEKFDDYKIEKGDNSLKGDGYAGIINTATISAKNDDKVLHLVVKSAAKSDAFRSQVPIDEIFYREIYMYTTVFPTFKAFEKDKGLNLCNFAPKLYNSLTENKYETLILENLKESGYELYEREVPLKQEHICLALTEYGRFHALSFALKDHNPGKFETILGCLDNRILERCLEINFSSGLIQQCVKGQEALHAKEDKKALDVYKAFVDTLQSFLESLVKSIDEYSVALHGDCWTTNMMFKYEDKANPNKPTRVCFLDFQQSRLGSPVLDLSYFLYSCSPEEVLNDLDRYIKIYYESFSDYLRKLGSDPDKMFPYTVLQQHWMKYSKYGLALSLFIIHLMLTEKEEAIDLADESESGTDISEIFLYDIKKFDEYKKRIRPIILHFVERGFI